MAGACEQMSEHPLGQAIVNFAREKQMELPMPSSFESITGAGILTQWEGRRVAVGNIRLLEQLHVTASDETREQAARFANEGKDVYKRQVHGSPHGGADHRG